MGESRILNLTRPGNGKSFQVLDKLEDEERTQLRRGGGVILVSRGNAPPVNHCQAVAVPLLVSAARELIPVTEACAGYVPGTWPPNPDAVLVATVRNSRNKKLQLAERGGHFVFRARDAQSAASDTSAPHCLRQVEMLHSSTTMR